MTDIRELLKTAAAEDASDVHISVGASPRLRVHGDLVTTNFPKMTPADTLEMLLGLVNPDQRERFEQDGVIDISVSIPDVGRFRVNAYKQRGSITLALRLVDMEIPDAVELAIPDQVMSLCERHRGLILVTGPSGSGKSTVLAAMIDRINSTRSCNIITLEDPIEYLHAHKMSIVNQREIGLDVSTYDVALKSALREDPDVMLVSKLENAENISTAFMAAETGTLVFSTAYSSCAEDAIEGLIDMYPENKQAAARNRLASVLRAVISRQLLTCANGRDRAAAYEVLMVDNSVRSVIRSGEPGRLDDIMSAGRDRGMVTMDQSLTELCKQGKIDRQTAIIAARDQEKMSEILK